MELPSHWESNFSNKAEMSVLKEIIIEGPELPSKTMHSLTPKRDGLLDMLCPMILGPKSDQKGIAYTRVFTVI